MPRRARPLAGMRIRSLSPKVETHSDFGPPASPNRNHSPGGIYIKSEHDMSDDRYPPSSRIHTKSEHDMPDGRHPSPSGSFIKSEHDLSDCIKPSPGRPSIKLEHHSSPHHSPSLSGSFIKFEHDLLDDQKPSGDEDSSPPETAKETMPKNARKHSERMRIVHHFLNKEMDETHDLSENSKRRLDRMARIAHYECRSSAKKRLKHLQWAARTLTVAAFTPYVRLFRVDGEMTRLVRQMELKQQPVKERPNEASILKVLEKLSARGKYRVLRNLANELDEECKETRDNFNMWALTLLDEAWHPKFERVIKKQQARYQKMIAQNLLSRPLANIPFNTVERDLVEGLLSLLMRVSESVARRAWPQKPQRATRATTKEFRRIHREMKRDEHLLDAMRARIDIGWSDPIKSPYVSRLSTSKLIVKIQALDLEILGMSLLPSKKCILQIIKLILKVASMEERSTADDDDRCAMPAKLVEELKSALCQMDIYDRWRATNPPDSDRYIDFWMEDARQRLKTP